MTGTRGPRHRTTRLLLAVAMMGAALPVRALAEPGSPQLLLPLLGALAITRGAFLLHASRPPAGGIRAMLPESLHIPDTYAIDFDRDPPRFAKPVDRRKLVSLDLLPRPVRGTMLSLSYDGESARIGSGSKLFRVVLEMRF